MAEVSKGCTVTLNGREYPVMSLDLSYPRHSVTSHPKVGDVHPIIPNQICSSIIHDCYTVRPLTVLEQLKFILITIEEDEQYSFLAELYALNRTLEEW